jgi:hypothetical protein
LNALARSGFFLPAIFSASNNPSVGAAAGCDLLILKKQDQKIAACGSSYMGICVGSRK